VFFFSSRRRHTRFSRDWSSDVCSSDLVILLDDEGNEIVLPKEKQIPSDFFRKGDNVKGIIESVELKGNKPQILMSRTSERFLERSEERRVGKESRSRWTRDR